MSLYSLPDELILKIYYQLTHGKGLSEHRHESDDFRYLVRQSKANYFNLASTCKRFLYLAEHKYNPILDRETLIKTIHSSRMKSNTSRDIPYHNSLPEDQRMCPIHGVSARDKTCIQRGLYPILAFKYIRCSKIHIELTDLRKANCILAYNSSNFDNIIRLELSQCKLNSQVLGDLLIALKNVTWLQLISNEYFQGDKGQCVPVLERTLDHLGVDDLNCTDHPLLHPNLRLSVKMIHIHLGVSWDDWGEEKIRAVWEIMDRFKEHINILRVSGSNGQICRKLDVLRSTGLKLDIPVDFEHADNIYCRHMSEDMWYTSLWEYGSDDDHEQDYDEFLAML